MQPALQRTSRMACDLHLHSTASDGTWTPLQVLQEAEKLGLRAISLTDHDTVAGVLEALPHVKEFSFDFVPGLEINTEAEERDIHILGYYPDLENPKLQQALQRVRDLRLERLDRILQKLAELGIRIRREEVLAVAQGKSVGRPHVAEVLYKKGFARTKRGAFDRFLLRGKPAYVPRYKLTPQKAIELIKAAGGIPVLAHPHLVGDDTWIYRLQAAGLEGLECFHSTHTPELVEHYLEIARKQALVITGGSDSHGPGGAPALEMGKANVPDWVYEGLAAYHLSTRG